MIVNRIGASSSGLRVFNKPEISVITLIKENKLFLYKKYNGFLNNMKNN